MKKPAEAPKGAQEAKKPAVSKSISPLKKKGARSPEIEPVFAMPAEVSAWIERANSIMNHQRGQIDRLKVEVDELKAYKRWAEQRILRSEHE